MNGLQFNNYNSATTNGLDMNSAGFGANNQLSMGTPVANTSTPGMTNMGVTDTTTVLGGNSSQNGPGFWSKEGGAGLALGGLQILGNLWSSYQAHKMAKDQMSFAKDQWNTNLQNQTQTYNTALEDRIRGRYADGVRTDSQVQNEINRHSL